ncbi:hypothetical protein J1N35_045022 [Gossypium stocksii]|uniref:Uncharacterized protein n=1 Tax=Gossypium stocksii TaxID=47602 RepID=A0A9D3UA81_9ROSI|nr:hypothetical protein J1N35_045022 [Gossypium stocksii]
MGSKEQDMEANRNISKGINEYKYWEKRGGDELKCSDMKVKQGPRDRKRKKKRNTRWQRSQVKGKKSICLQSSTEQCFPRSGNWGVPSLIQLPQLNQTAKI